MKIKMEFMARSRFVSATAGFRAGLCAGRLAGPRDDAAHRPVSSLQSLVEGAMCRWRNALPMAAMARNTRTIRRFTMAPGPWTIWRCSTAARKARNSISASICFFLHRGVLPPGGDRRAFPQLLRGDVRHPGWRGRIFHRQPHLRAAGTGAGRWRAWVTAMPLPIRRPSTCSG